MNEKGVNVQISGAGDQTSGLILDGGGGRDRTRADAVLETAALPLSYTPVRSTDDERPRQKMESFHSLCPSSELVPGDGVEPPTS